MKWVIVIGLMFVMNARASSLWPTEVCRVISGKSTCIRWNSDCSQGEKTKGLPGKKISRCRALDATRCAAVRKLISEAISSTRQLPTADWTGDRIQWMSCDGFEASASDQWIAACLNRHPGGVELLFSAYRAVLEVCDASP